LRGRVDPAALQQALVAAVQRHEVLRATFREVDGHPLATTAPVVSLRLPVTELDPADIPGELARVVAAETRTRFDLAKGPLVRASLLRIAADDHVLLITAHQMVADQRSVRLLTDEVLTTYAGGAADTTPADFHAVVTAQREWVDGDEAIKDIEYWREQLAALPALELPTDRTRPPMKTIAGAAVSVPVPEATTAALDAHASATGADHAHLLLAAYASVLSRYSQQDDLAIGVAVPATWHADGTSLIGPLENALPLRLELTGDETLERLLERTAAVSAEATAHGRLSFDRIVEAAQPQRDLSHTPLFQVSFSYQRQPESVELPGATAVPVDLPVTWTAHDIDLVATRRGPALALRAQYNTDLFDRDTVERLLGHVLLLLDSALAEPTRPLAEFALLSERERELVVRTWNDTRTEHDRTRTLHGLVEAAAEAHPGAVAVVAGDAELTYGSLDARANALASELIAAGAAAETRVGVLVDRTPHAVVGLLGVLKAGGAYVPLDPTYPADRLAFILADAAITTVVGSEAVLAGLPEQLSGLTRIAVPTADPATSARPSTTVDPADLAYVIYTSGSTGRPKGVAVEHRQIVHSTEARSACAGPGLPERYLVLAPLTFDASGGGLYWTLASGGTVVLPTEAEVLDPRLLGALIRSREVTHVDGVPSQYAVLLETDPQAHDSVRTTILAGEALPPALIGEHFRRNPGSAL
ncbi:non-ribosomal peptide synthetase, partial [Actinosynnema sp.]